MCGRITQNVKSETLVANYGVRHHPELDLTPHYNGAPGQDFLAVRNWGGERLLEALRWGYIAGCAVSKPGAKRLINARSETVHEKPSFGSASARAPSRSTPPAPGCTTSRGRRTWCPQPASRRSPPGATLPRPRSATGWSGSGATASARLPRARPTSSAPFSPTGAASRAWCSRGSSSGTTTRGPARTPRWSARADDRPEAGRVFAPSPRSPCAPWRTPCTCSGGPAVTAHPRGREIRARPAGRPR